MPKPLRTCVSWYLIVAMLVIGITPNVYAGFSPSEAVALSQVDRTYDLQIIQKVLETKMIKQRLHQLGFSQGEIQARIEQLDDEQIHQLALNLDELKVGAGGFEVLVIVLLIGILVALWMQVTGRRVFIK